MMEKVHLAPDNERCVQVRRGEIQRWRDERRKRLREKQRLLKVRIYSLGGNVLDFFFLGRLLFCAVGRQPSLCAKRFLEFKLRP